MTVYDEIAQSWHSFKRKPFPLIVGELAKEWKGSILDVGCGNGRNLLAFDGELVGVDNSNEMITIAREHAHTSGKKAVFLVADATKLPFKDAHFDHVLCVAMLHHLPLDRQTIALHDMRRVLKPGGTLLVTVWNKWQRRFVFGPTEQMVPWTTKGKTFERYYYMHNYFSLRKLLRTAGFGIERIECMLGPNVIAVVSRNA